MKVVVDRLVQYPNRYKLTNVDTGAVLGTFDFVEETGTVQQVGTEINKELFDSIADDLALKVNTQGGNASALVVDFPEITTVENITTGETVKSVFSKIASWFKNRIANLKKFTYDSNTKIAKSDIADGVIPSVVQTTGASTSAVMSQSATTSAVNTALSSAKTYADGAVSGVITQQTGTSETTVMSQKAVTTELDKKVDKVSGKQLSTNDYTTAEKTKLAGIAEGANKYILPIATSSVLGGIKSGNDITISTTGLVTVLDDSHNHVISNIDGLQTILDTIPTKYAGSSSAGGSATSAVKLNTDAGSGTQPVYFVNGIPVKTTYTLGASVPSGAKFTDTDTGATSVAIGGSGNAVTAASYDASTRKLTLTKGTTFLTAHQSLANYVTLDGTQTITGAKTIGAGKTLTFAGTSNSGCADIKWGTVNSKVPYIGYAKNQTDGTFVWSITGTNYETGLAIGGGSGNLLWKGTRVATVSDIPSYSVATQSANGLMSATDKKKLDSNVVTLDGTQTITGVKTFNAPTNVASTEQVTAWFNTANGGRVGFGKEKDNSGTGIFFDQVSGTRRLNFRASATAGAMVWAQPEEGAQLYIDLGKQGSDYHRITMPSSSGTLALTSQITKSQVGLSNVANVLQYSASNPNFGTTTPLMDGTGAVGSATTYSRSDHRHPTDTSRASTATATTSSNGLMSSTDKTKLDNMTYATTAEITALF